MPLIQNFKSTNVWNAFILNSIAAAIVIVIGISVKEHFDTYIVDDNNSNKITIEILYQ